MQILLGIRVALVFKDQLLFKTILHHDAFCKKKFLKYVMGQKLYDHSFLILLEIQNKFSFSLRKWQKKNKNQAAAAVFIPNYHGPLKLFNCHGVDGKSWFKKQGPLLALGSDDKVAFTVLPLFFCVYYESYPPSPSSGNTV